MNAMKPLMLVLFLLTSLPAALGEKRLVIIDQDGSGPGGSNQMSMMVLLQSPDAEVLGITMVTGNAWRDEEVQHTLRMLELMKRTDVPVVPGAVFPLVRTQQGTRLATPLMGRVNWLGAWGAGPMDLEHESENKPDFSRSHDPYFVPPLPEGAPHTLPLDQDAAHFLIAQVRAHRTR
jgi:purine nucleosidase